MHGRVTAYKMRRNELILQLGARCEICGSEENLEFDHPYGRDWVARKQNRLHRLRLYARDYAAGNLRLLCGPCNKTHPPLFGDFDDLEETRP